MMILWEIIFLFILRYRFLHVVIIFTMSLLSHRRFLSCCWINYIQNCPCNCIEITFLSVAKLDFLQTMLGVPKRVHHKLWDNYKPNYTFVWASEENVQELLFKSVHEMSVSPATTMGNCPKFPLQLTYFTVTIKKLQTTLFCAYHIL